MMFMIIDNMLHSERRLQAYIFDGRCKNRGREMQIEASHNLQNEVKSRKQA